MTYIADTVFIFPSERQDTAEDHREAQDYLDARRDAADAMLSIKPRVLGSIRLARLLGVNTRLQREIEG